MKVERILFKISGLLTIIALLLLNCDIAFAANYTYNLYGEDYWENGHPGYESLITKNSFYNTDDGINFYEDGKRSDFTGIISEDGKLCYVQNGELQDNYEGIYEYNGVLYLIYDGFVSTSYNGIYDDGNKIYLIEDGRVIDKTGFYEEDGIKYYLQHGKLQTNITGIKKIGNKKYYIEHGMVDLQYSDILKFRGVYYVVERGVVKRKTSKRCNRILKLQKKYPEGKRWTNKNSYAWTAQNYACIGYGCAAFSYIASDAAYGKKAKVIKHKKFSKIKSGDIIRLGGHSVVVLEKLSKGVIVVEGNYNSSIHWFRYISLSEIKKTGLYVQTRK